MTEERKAHLADLNKIASLLHNLKYRELALIEVSEMVAKLKEGEA